VSDPRGEVSPDARIQELQRQIAELERGRAQAESQLADWQERYRFLFNNMLTGYAYHRMVLDDAGEAVDYEFLEINDTFEELTGLRRAALVGRRVTEALPGIDQGEFDWIGTYAKVAMDGETWQSEQYSAQLDRWYSVTAHSPERGYFVVVFHDITQRHRAEQALHEREEQLRQAQKMEAVGRLAGGIAHDFNNLLTVISGYAERAEVSLGEDASELQSIREIRAAGDRAASLCGQLLAFSRRQVLELRPLDPSEVFRNLGSLVDRLLGGDIRVAYDLPETLGTVRADRGQLEQVLMNLAVNARDAMPDGGRFEVSGLDVTLDGPMAHSRGTLAAGDWVRLAVKDTGSGIPADVIDRVFEPFFTTKGVGVGTGLGLSTVYGIVRQVGGEILVQSEEGLGTTFEIYLPRTAEAPAVVLEAPRAKAVRGGTETILVAEDDDAVRGLTSLVLRDAGYAVLEAAGGSQAMLHALAHPEPIDLVLSDILMPDTTGPDLIERVCEQRPEAAGLLMSGYLDPERVGGVVELPLLRKPFSATGLREAVRQVLDQRSAA
jgi:two-component system, cell cycle sensor histidine kinase and response regulator CckA